MSYFENIKEDVSSAIKIKKLAKSLKINYVIAKIMYHNGKNDIDYRTALKIYETLKELNIPFNLIDVLDIIDEYLINNELDLEILYKKIAYKIDRKYIDELSKYTDINSGANYYYGKYLYDLIKKGIPLSVAIKKFELSVIFEMKRFNLSEFSALAKLLFFKDNNVARVFENEYINKRAIVNSPYETIRNYLLFSPNYKRKIVNGITLISKTDKGLLNLEQLVNKVYTKANPNFLSVLTQEAFKNELILIDFPFYEYENTEYVYLYRYIYINQEKINYEDYWIYIFYHEATHFLDNMFGISITNELNSWFSSNDLTISKIIKFIKNKINIHEKALNIRNSKELVARNYANDKKKKKKWMQQIKTEYQNSDNNTIQLYMQQKKLYEMEKYKRFLVFLADIYDGLSCGLLKDEFNLYGHGTDYYSDYKHVLIEFLANIGVFYNTKEFDILCFEFGEELTKKIIKMYEIFLNFEKINEDTRKIKKIPSLN